MSEFTDGLRSVADWLDAHPEYNPLARDFPVFFYGNNATEELESFARSLGHAEKRSIGPFVEVRRSFGPHSISGIAEREQPASAPDAADQDLRGAGVGDPLLSARPLESSLLAYIDYDPQVDVEPELVVVRHGQPERQASLGPIPEGAAEHDLARADPRYEGLGALREQADDQLEKWGLGRFEDWQETSRGYVTKVAVVIEKNAQ